MTKVKGGMHRCGMVCLYLSLEIPPIGMELHAPVIQSVQRALENILIPVFDSTVISFDYPGLFLKLGYENPNVNTELFR